MRVNYVIIFVSDMQRSVAFYRDVFGLPLQFDSPGWSEFATDGATLALHLADAAEAAADDRVKVPAGRCRPGLSVPNLDAFHATLMQHNVVCAQEPASIHGVRIAQYLDPDGLAISVSEERPA